MDEDKIVIFGGTMEDWGFILSFIHADDTRSVIEQFNDRYVSGWNKFEGFKFDPDTLKLSYPGDPPYYPVSIAMFRHELIILYPSAWVLVVQPDKSWQIARMD